MTVYFSSEGGNKTVKSMKFSGGELHVTSEFKAWPTGAIQVAARMQSSDDVMELVMATELLRRRALPNTIMRLVIPYFPYARQDRVTDQHTSFSLKAFASLINSLKYDAVTVYDPHSDVTPALVDNCEVIEQDSLVHQFAGLDEWIRTHRPVIVAPDAGAAKKAWKVAQHYGLQMETATKHRDTTNGKIIDTSLGGSPNIHGKSVLIVDDICDGGGTFIPLGKLLKDCGASSVALYVTHGIFSKGYDVFKGAIDRLYCTDTFIPANLPQPDQVPLFIGKVCPRIME